MQSLSEGNEGIESCVMDKDAPEIESPDCQTAREEMDEFLQGMESRHQELLARLDHQDAALRHSLSELGSEFADRWLFNYSTP